jgi:hypothetical protein
VSSSLLSKSISIFANGTTSTNGQMVVDKRSANSVKVLVDFNGEEYYSRVAKSLCNKVQSATIGSFAEQRAMWRRPPKKHEGSIYVCMLLKLKHILFNLVHSRYPYSLFLEGISFLLAQLGNFRVRYVSTPTQRIHVPVYFDAC